jgi:heme exporter protein A
MSAAAQPTHAAAPGWFEVRDLALVRGNRLLFDGIGFGLARGEAMLLRGPNGSGKSSLLRALLGLAVPRRGELLLDGDRFPATSGRLRPHALFQGHADGLKGELDALENLALAAGLDGFDTGEPALRQALAETGILREAALPVRRLSQGQRQRLSLSRFALANRESVSIRPLWLLDEPSAALDDAGAAMLDGLLRAHLSRGGAAIVATHLPVLAAGAAGQPTRMLALGKA